jgi:hypothetical protein
MAEHSCEKMIPLMRSLKPVGANDGSTFGTIGRLPLFANEG